MRLLIIIIFCGSILNLNSQDTQGKITFERKVFWVNLYSKLPFLTQEEKEKELAIWGKEQGKNGEKYDLEFNSNQSLYKEVKSENEGGWSWRGDEILIFRDLANKTIIDKIPLAEKDFLIKGDIPRIKWKIQNELRDIQGYICMKAVGIHSIHNTPITAWYTDKIPVSFGPEGLTGLPGMILLVSYGNDDVIIEATAVTLEKDPKVITLPKKIKGKEITFEKFKEDYNKYIQESISAKRNPYWRVRL